MYKNVDEFTKKSIERDFKIQEIKGKITFKDFQEDYGKEYKTIKDIEEQTTVIKLKNNFSYEGLEALYNDLKENNTSFIIQQF